MSEKQTKKSIDSKQQSKQTKKAPYRIQRGIAYVLIVLTVIGSVGAGVVGIYAATQIAKAPDVKSEDFTSQAASDMYADDETTVFYNTGVKRRDNITYDQISNSMIDALVSIEDSRFFKHGGFDVPRFTKAALNNVLSSLRSGSLSFGEGGSTLTMQLIKNSIFVKDGNGHDGEVIQAQGGINGISRKVQEIYLSQKIEHEGILSKKMIMELYLNKISFGVGNNVMGLENSAKAYFGKSAAELNTVESAFLAGVINAPFGFSPYSSIEAANKRTADVLYQMFNHGYISQEEYDIAKNVRVEDLLVESKSTDGDSMPYQAFADIAYREAIELTGEDPARVGMKIYTTMNQSVQDGIDKVQRREVAAVRFDDGSNIQIGSTIVNNKNGEIVGTVGGYNYTDALGNNRGHDLPKPPASTLKPVIAYAPAYQYLGWATDHIVEDKPIELNGLIMSNYDNKYLGQIPIDTAVADSRNIPALETFQQVKDKIGEDAYKKLLTDNGLPIGTVNVNGQKEDAFSWTHVIGIDPFYATTAEMAGATATLFNGGEHNKPHTIRRIEFTDGRPPYIPDRTPKKVFSPGAAYMATRGMKYVIDSNMNDYTSPVRRNYPVFGKTGTNEYDRETAEALNIPAGSSRDRLMITATSDFTMSTWVGFDRHLATDKPYFNDKEKDKNVPGQLNSYLLTLLEKAFGPGKDIPEPSDVTKITHIKGPFPYQSPLPDMNSNLISTGWILKDFAKLSEAKPQDLQEMASQSVQASMNGSRMSFNVTMAEYPDASKLSEASRVISYPDLRGGSVSGTRLYDESWLYGAVRYRTVVRADGEVIAELSNGSPTQKLEASIPKGTTDLQVCSMYTFDRAPKRVSQEQCSKIDTTNLKDAVPNLLDLSFKDIKSWAQQVGATLNTSYQVRNNAAFDSVVQIKPNPSGKLLSADELRALTLEVVLADTEISAQGTVGQFIKRYRGQFNFDEGSAESSDEITGFLINGRNVSSFRLSEVGNTNVTLIVNAF